MSALRPVLAVALAAGCLFGTAAHAADAPKTTDKSATFFLAQEGCGATAEPGRLLPKATASGATGCGAIGGVPVYEVAAHVEDVSEPFSTTGKGLPIKLDGSKKITGQLAASSWFGAGVGAGQVTFDVALTGVDVSGKSIDFGETTVTATASPGEEFALVPFELTVPATATKAMKSFTLDVAQRGANFGFSAKQLDGESYLVLPTKKK